MSSPHLNSPRFMNSVDIEKISSRGAEIYAKKKTEYEPRHNGKFLAIDIDSEDVYLANDGAQAVELARDAHPGKVFYLVKVGYETAEMVAHSFAMSP